MLSLPNDGRYPALELTPQQRRQRTLEALVSQIGALTRQSPVLMIFEDVHWIDPTGLEVLGRAVGRIATLPVLLIATFRPEFDPPWIGQPHVTALTINRLTQREIGAMIDRVVGNKVLPASIRQDIVERTDGIPLFVEEMTKTVWRRRARSRPGARSRRFHSRPWRSPRACTNPITGVADCCAPAARGHASAVQPRSAINSRASWTFFHTETHDRRAPIGDVLSSYTRPPGSIP
jgi:hypothetical protein